MTIARFKTTTYLQHIHNTLRKVLCPLCVTNRKRCCNLCYLPTRRRSHALHKVSFIGKLFVMHRKIKLDFHKKLLYEKTWFYSVCVFFSVVSASRQHATIRVQTFIWNSQRVWCSKNLIKLYIYNIIEIYIYVR